MDFALGKGLRELPGPIMITGHTGFKGTWLTLLLQTLKIPVIGFSLPPEKDSLFDRTQRTGAIPEVFQDVRSVEAVSSFMSRYEPSVVVHMAAQPLVLESYKNPCETFETNIMGTVNILDSAFKTNSVKAVLVITTDKVYRNDNSGIAFIESDPLEGKDPYSASKVGTESVVAAWQQISRVSGGPKVISARAGNVIGGGDWAADRLMPDLIRSFILGTTIKIRNPDSSRPWQHVLDPLHGYVLALEALLCGVNFNTVNLGPNSESLTVRQMTEICLTHWPVQIESEFGGETKKSSIESIELQLNSDWAHTHLRWKPCWSQQKAGIATMDWWNSVLIQGHSPIYACEQDIHYLLGTI
jgi:CDP-glucose 4,6-dehydratase